MICANCNVETEGNFCNNCGTKLDNSQLIISKEPEISIGFGKSSSANYSYVVELMQKQENYEYKEKDAIHFARFNDSELDDFFEIFNNVKQWKSSFIVIDGKKMPVNKIRTGLNCYRERLRSYDPEKYCFGFDSTQKLYDTNPIGCRHCGASNNSWSGWLNYGSINKLGFFILDKNRLKHDVKKNIEDIGYCPVLNSETIIENIDQLPDQINPKKDKRFEYVTTYENGKEFATGIRFKSESSDFVVKDYNTGDYIDEDFYEDYTHEGDSLLQNTDLTHKLKPISKKGYFWILGTIVGLMLLSSSPFIGMVITGFSIFKLIKFIKQNKQAQSM